MYKGTKIDEVLSVLIKPLEDFLKNKVEGITKKITSLEKGTIKVFTEKVNLWELDTGIYYLNGGFNYTKSFFVEGGKHIFMIYKPQPLKKAVRYIHFCGGISSEAWSAIDCGYTDGDTCTEYQVLDTSQLVSDIRADITGKKPVNSTAVKKYVNEVIGGIENGSY